MTVPLIMGKVCGNPMSALDNLCLFSWLEEVIFHFPARERKLQRVFYFAREHGSPAFPQRVEPLRALRPSCL